MISSKVLMGVRTFAAASNLNINLKPMFNIHLATSENSEEILNFMFKYFLPDEPICLSQKLTENDIEPVYRLMITACLFEPSSFLARNPETDQLMGIRMAFPINRPGLAQSPGDKLLHGLESDNPKILNIMGLLEVLSQHHWKGFPQHVNRILHALVLCSDPKYRGMGLATSLVKHAQIQARSLGCQGELSETTAAGSQRLYEKLGYKIGYAIEYATWKSQNGEAPFKNIEKPTHCLLKYHIYDDK